MAALRATTQSRFLFQIVWSIPEAASDADLPEDENSQLWGSYTGEHHTCRGTSSMHELGRRPHDLTPIPNHLFGIFAASATEIWACGQDGVMLNSNGDRDTVCAPVFPPSGA